MDDQYRMIEQDIESLLNDSQDVATELSKTPETMKPNDFLSYTRWEANKQPFNYHAMEQGSNVIRTILSQYAKWSTVESDELNTQHYTVEQSLAAPMLPTMNLTVEMMQNILFNFWSAQLGRNNIMNMTKQMCSFCRKNGKNFATYTSHSLRVNGILQCPYLMKCQCTNCYKSGHTTRYCPMKAPAGPAFTLFDRNPLNRYN